MNPNVYRPPTMHEEAAVVRQRDRVSGARILMISFGMSIALPQAIGFFAGLHNASSAPTNAPSPEAAIAALRRILAFNALVHPAALTAVPLGTWIFAQKLRAAPDGHPPWSRFGALLVAIVAVALARVRGVRRFLQGAMPSRSYELDLVLTLSETLMLVAVVLLIVGFARGRPRERREKSSC